MEQNEKTQLLLGKESVAKLKAKSVIIFGIGGVGGYVAEMLARTGVGKLTLVDFDVISKSNLNRQIMALHSTIGRLKAEVMKERLLDINPELEIIALNKRYDISTKSEFNLLEYDYVVDAIDSVMQKIDLIVDAKKQGAKFISGMGTGNRNAIPEFKVGDVFETTYDGLARKIRKVLRKNNITELKVVYTVEKPKALVPPGSLVYYPTTCASLITAQIIQDFIKN